MILKHPTIPNYTKDLPDSPKRIAKSWKSTGWLPATVKRETNEKPPEPEPGDTE